MTDIIHNALMFQNRALNLDLIKRRLDRCLYKRLDLFQRDIFSVLERARNLSRTDSQIFEDSCELQKHFIKIRDEVSLIFNYIYKDCSSLIELFKGYTISCF